MAARETGELKEAKEKLEMRVELLTWRWQVEKRLRIYLQEAKAQETAKLQDALYAMQIQVEEANSRDHKEREAAAQIAIEEAPPVVKDTPYSFQYAEKFDSLMAVVENLKAMLLSERQAAEESRKVCIDAEVRIADVAKKMEDTVQKVDQLQDLVQRLADKLSYSESENQVLRQQARISFIDEQQGGLTPALIKAEVPWSVQSGNLSEKERVLKTVEGILNKLTPETFDLLKGQLIFSGITTADILKGVVLLIYEKAVLEPIFCPMYAQLCSDLHKKLHPFPSDEPDGKKITFRRVLLNHCQEAFESADKLRTEVRQMYAPEYEVESMDKERRVELRILGNIRFIGELVKQKMVLNRTVHRIILELLGADNKSCRSEENVEAICLFFNTIGKQLDESPKSRHINDLYFDRLKELPKNPQLAPHLRFMICDVLDVRANNWV